MATVKRKPQQTQRKGQAIWLGTVVTLMVLTIAGIALGSYLSQPGRLPLKRIQVSGEFKHLDQREVERRVVAAIDGGFFDVDMAALREVVVDMPWIEEVSIRRVWPDRLVMTVSEQRPLARWGDDALVNLRGEIFRPADIGGTEGLVVLRGPAPAARQLVRFHQEIQPRAVAAGLKIGEIRLDGRRDWWVRFDNGLLLSLGKEALRRRVADFVALYPGLDGDGSRMPARVDMRYEHGLAVQWRERPPATPSGAATRGGAS